MTYFNVKRKAQGLASRFSLCTLYFLLFALVCKTYALDLDKMKACFINGDYKQVISEGEKILAASSSDSPGLDELYYLLGLSYLRENNYLRASDIFEIIINEFKSSPFSEEAGLGLADAYFLRGDYAKAQEKYKNLLNIDRANPLKASIYYRLSQCAVKSGDTQAAKDYLDKLKREFPLNIEAGLNGALVSADFYYSVQVGSFSNSANANNLAKELLSKGYPAYVEQADSQGKPIYRVRVGKLELRKEAADLEAKLSREGYPTKICP